MPLRNVSCSFKLEPINHICPRCGKGQYMRALIGDNVGDLDVKCINCNTYFKSADLYSLNKSDNNITHLDELRAMSAEDLAKFINSRNCPPFYPSEVEESIEYQCETCIHIFDDYTCHQCWVDWLNEKVGV